MTAAGTTLRTGNPYVGPVSFRDGDALYGRDREREDLVDLLVAERIVLLYSPSGAGKTSLLQAALIPALRRDGFDILPVIRVTHTLEPRPGLATPRNRYVTSVLLSLEEGLPPDLQRPVSELATLTLTDYLKAYTDRTAGSGNEVLIFDQFEEVLTADPTDETAKHEFFAELGQLLRDRAHWALFSMREDFLAALDPYLVHIPTRLRTTFRLDLLSVDEALEAMRRPAADAGAILIEQAAQQLVDDLRTVRVQRPTGITKVLGSYVEPVQLQVACHLLWSMLPADAREITRGDVEGLGRVDQALADYYAERVRTAAERTGVPERIIRDWFEERLITPQELRSQVLEGPEPSGEAGQRLLGELLDAHLIRAETRRQATWYELAHDRLIDPVRRDNAAWRAQNLSSLDRAAELWEQEGRPDRLLLLGEELAVAERDDAAKADTLGPRQLEFLNASRHADEQLRRDQRTSAVLRRSARRLRIAVAMTTLLAVVAGVLSITSLNATSEAENQRNLAERQEVGSRLLVGAQEHLASDDLLAVALAAEGGEKYGADNLADHARRVLYRAAESPIALVLRDQAGPTTAADFSADGSTIVTAGAADIRLWDRSNGAPRESSVKLEENEVVNAVTISSDASTVVAGLRNGTLLVWKVGALDPVRWRTGSTVWSVALSPDGNRIASVGSSDRVRVWDLEGNLLSVRKFPHATMVYDVAFSPDGRWLAASGDAPTDDKHGVVLWDTGSDRQAELPLGDEGGAFIVRFGKESDRLATVTWKAVTVWDVSTGRPISRLDTSWSYANNYNLNPDLSRALSVDSYGTVSVYDMATEEPQEIARARVAGARLCCAGFDVDPNRVFVLAEEADPSFWKLNDLTNDAEAQVAAVAGGHVFSAWDDGRLRREGTKNGSGAGDVVQGVDVKGVHQLAADAGGGWLASASKDQVRVWDTQDWSEKMSWKSSDFSFTAIDLTPDGKAVVVADSTGKVTRWDIASGTRLDEVEPTDRDIARIEVTDDGSTVLLAYGPRDTTDSAVAAGQSDGSEPAASLVSLSDSDFEPVGLELRESDDQPRRIDGTTVTETVTAAAFSPDHRQVIVGTSKGRVAGFDTVSGERRWSKVVHQGEVSEVVVDGSTGDLLTISEAASMSQVVLLNGTGEVVRTVPSTSDLMAAMRTPDGEQMVLYTTEGLTRTVPLGDAELMALVKSKDAHTLTDDECALYRVETDC